MHSVNMDEECTMKSKAATLLADGENRKAEINENKRCDIFSAKYPDNDKKHSKGKEHEL